MWNKKLIRSNFYSEHLCNLKSHHSDLYNPNSIHNLCTSKGIDLQEKSVPTWTRRLVFGTIDFDLLWIPLILTFILEIVLLQNPYS